MHELLSSKYLRAEAETFGCIGLSQRPAKSGTLPLRRLIHKYVKLQMNRLIQNTTNNETIPAAPLSTRVPKSLPFGLVPTCYRVNLLPKSCSCIMKTKPNIKQQTASCVNPSA